MTFGLGVALLLIGNALTFLARERADGTALLRLSGNMVIIYVPICLAFFAFGIALMIMG